MNVSTQFWVSQFSLESVAIVSRCLHWCAFCSRSHSCRNHVNAIQYPGICSYDTLYTDANCIHMSTWWNIIAHTSACMDMYSIYITFVTKELRVFLIVDGLTYSNTIHNQDCDFACKFCYIFPGPSGDIDFNCFDSVWWNSDFKGCENGPDYNARLWMSQLNFECSIFPQEGRYWNLGILARMSLRIWKASATLNSLKLF